MKIKREQYVKRITFHVLLALLPQVLHLFAKSIHFFFVQRQLLNNGIPLTIADTAASIFAATVFAEVVRPTAG